MKEFYLNISLYFELSQNQTKYLYSIMQRQRYTLHCIQTCPLRKLVDFAESVIVSFIFHNVIKQSIPYINSFYSKKYFLMSNLAKNFFNFNVFL